MRNLTLRDPSFLGASLLSVSNSPLLNIPFSANRTLTDTVSGGSLITFSRAAATGTFIDSSGVLQTAAADTARFTTDPLTLVSLGLLGEEARTNLLLRSEEFNNASWTKLNSVTVAANAINAPSGTITADKIIEPASSADKPIVQPVTLAASTTYTASVYFKAAERPAILFHVRKNDYSTRFGGFFNTSTNTFTSETSAGGVLDSFVFNNVGEGWYRCSITGNVGANTAGLVTIYIVNASNSLTYTGDGTSGIYLWGAQLETSLTSYISTTSATATRNADVADITSANSALISAIRTLFVEFRSPAVGTRGVLSLNDGTANNRIEVRTNDTAVQVLIVTGGTTVTIAAGTITANARARLAVRIGAASSSASLNGAAPVTAAASRPTVDRAAIARSQANEYLNGTIATLTAWGQEFTDSMLVIQST